jgi:hypothetical protein
MIKLLLERTRGVADCERGEEEADDWGALALGIDGGLPLLAETAELGDCGDEELTPVVDFGDSRAGEVLGDFPGLELIESLSLGSVYF